MKFDRWPKENKMLVDWNLFSAPWDAMQLKHNPFRQEQIEAILTSSGILEKESPIVLDLGCGPGILGRQFIHQKPLTRYFGADRPCSMYSRRITRLSLPYIVASN